MLFVAENIGCECEYPQSSLNSVLHHLIELITKSGLPLLLDRPPLSESYIISSSAIIKGR